MFYALPYIRTLTYRLSTLLFAAVAAFVLVTLLLTGARRLALRIKSNSKRRIRDMVIRYMLEEAPLDGIVLRRSQHALAIEVFSSILSAIRGKKQERVKDAVQRLGLVTEIEGGIESPYAVKRLHSCYRLGMLGSKSSVQALARALDDRNARVAAAAIIALGEIRDERSIVHLLNFFLRCSFSHAWLIAGILPFFGPDTFPYLHPYLLPGLLPTPKLALLLRVIAEHRALESFELLEELYRKSGDLDVRIAALKAAGRTKDVRAVKMVMGALKSPEWQLRSAACAAISEMSAGGAAYRLIPLLKDGNWHVRHNAALALTCLGKTGMCVLLACLDIDDRYARDMVVHALEETGAVERAVNALINEDGAARKEAFTLVRALARKGYTAYISSFLGADPSIDRIVGEFTRG